MALGRQLLGEGDDADPVARRRIRRRQGQPIRSVDLDWAKSSSQLGRLIAAIRAMGGQPRESEWDEELEHEHEGGDAKQTASQVAMAVGLPRAPQLAGSDRRHHRTSR